MDSHPQIFLAKRSDKKSIMRFYKQSHYSAKFMGLDQCFYLTHEKSIIAAVIISQISQSNPQNFLHALVVAKKFQHHGLGSILLKHAHKKFSNLVCFADIGLSSLYLKSDFKETDIFSLSSELSDRFHNYSKKRNNLVIFCK